MARVRSAYGKDFLRSIAGSLGRFLAIAGIVALGAGFYAGLRMTAPDMKVAADEFWDGTALMDVRVVSTLGLTDAEIDELRDFDGVEAVMPAREADIMGTVGDEQYVMRLHSLDPSAASSTCGDGAHVASDDDDYLNRLVLAEGRWPAAPGEVVVSVDSVTRTPFSIGDTIEITECSQDVEETFAVTTLAIVGTVHSSYYTTLTNLGSTSLGSGSVEQAAWVAEGTFAKDTPYTEAFLAVEGARDAFAFSGEYDDAIAQVVSGIEDRSDELSDMRTDALRAEAVSEIDEAQADLDAARAEADEELASARSELDQAAASIAEGEADLSSARAAYESGRAELEAAKADGEAQIAATESQLSDAQAALDAARPDVDAARDALAIAWEQAGTTPEGASAALSSLEASISEARAELASLEEAGAGESDAVLALEERIALLDSQREALEGLIAQQATVDAFDDRAAEVEAGWAALEEARAELAARLEAGQRELDAALASLSDGESQLASARAAYDEGLADYEQASAEAESELSEAQADIDAARADVDALEAASIYVLDRSKNIGAASFEADSERIDSIASFFPLIFFLVAALVSLTTMTRMVDEERVLIGTYKALGYSRAAITMKYVGYAALASITGGLIGIAALSQVLPWVIQNAYAIIYIVPVLGMGGLPVDVPIAAASLGLGVGVTLVATWAAAAANLRERPASLMLPRAPKAGKRILLERIGPVWRRLSFLRKVCARNIFRYKKRFVMTVVGIAGCTALLLTGLGLHDAINDIIDKQFGPITVHTMTASVDEGMSDDSRAAVDVALDRDSVSAAARVHVEPLVVRAGDEDYAATAVVPSEPESFDRFIFMKPRLESEPIAMGQDSVVVTEKLANLVGAAPGDAIELVETDDAGNATGASLTLVVTDVMENYVENYVYVGPAAYEEAFGGSASENAVFANVAEDEAARESLSSDLLAISGVKTVSYNDETIDTYRSMISSVNIVVVVLVVAAAALAFIVLYNLTNINITERSREIATLKVLGFYPREVNAYIYREVAILSIIGAALGIVFGVFLEGSVVATAEVDQAMFGREIHVSSFIAAFALTMAFAGAVLVAMRCKLARIDMVESLKSIE